MQWEVVVPVLAAVVIPVLLLMITRRGRTGDAPGMPDTADRSILHCAAPIPPTAPRTDPAR